MRARYSAFASQDYEFLTATHLPDSGRPSSVAELEAASEGTEWLGLTVVAKDRGRYGDAEGTVEFVARYKRSDDSVAQELRERSRFRFFRNRWHYVSGTPAVGGKLGRNAPCPCGSGKKYKRCCMI